MRYLARTTLSALSASAKDCGFCAMIRQGIDRMRGEWILGWAEHSWADTCHSSEQIISLYNSRPWLTQYEAEIQGEKNVDEEKVLVILSFPKEGSSLELRLQLPPWPPLVDINPRWHENLSPQNRNLTKLEFFSEAGMTLQIEKLIALTDILSGRPSPWSAFISLGMPQTCLYEESGLQFLSKWLGECISSHQICRRRNNDQMPARLLQLSISDSTDSNGEYSKSRYKMIGANNGHVRSSVCAVN